MKIYVGNLSFAVKEDDLITLFQVYGEVISAKVIIDRETIRSKGFGFVEMSNDEEAKKAIEALNGSELMGRPLKVSKTEQIEDRGGFGGGGGRPSSRPSGRDNRGRYES